MVVKGNPYPGVKCDHCDVAKEFQRVSGGMCYNFKKKCQPKEINSELV